ncbi:MAG: HEAT repeat domain-containing protein [Deltaproteobacteria bacterium]|nr:HEAT repeat domain-containing protein [Deltaproteobacteria bacterium]
MHTKKNSQRGLINVLSLILFFLFLFPAHALLQEKKGVEKLIRDLQADKPLVRRDAAAQLGKAKDARVVEPLLMALRDEDEGVRREATKALGEIGDPRTAKPLSEMLNDTDEFVRVNALEALERIRSDEAVNLSIGGLKNTNPLVRINACASLGRIGNKKAIPFLEEVAKADPLSYVRFAAEQALVLFRGEAIVKAQEKERIRRVVADEKEIPSLAELAQVAERIQGRYGLVLDYKKYDIMDLLDIEVRMRMRYSRDTIESLLGDLLTQEDRERNKHLFEPKQ